MSFKIQNNLQTFMSVRNLEKNQNNFAKIVERLSSGDKINSAADGAAEKADISRLRAEIKSLDAAGRNIMDATSTIQVADGGMSQVQEMMIRMKELATQAASANAGQSLGAINNELQSLSSEINRIVGSTEYNGEKLLDGSFSNTYQIGDKNNAESQLNMSFGDLSTASINEGNPLNANITNITDAQSLLSDIDSSMDYLAAKRAEAGVYANRLEYQQSNLLVSMENKIAAESVIADTDMAAEITEFTKTQILMQADTAILAQTNASAQIPLNLIK